MPRRLHERCTQLFDSLAVRIDSLASAAVHLRLCWIVTGDDTYLTELRNGALHHLTVPAPPPGVTTFRLTRPVLIDVLTGAIALTDALADGTATVAGDPGELGTLVGCLAPPVDPGFAIITP